MSKAKIGRSGTPAPKKAKAPAAKKAAKPAAKKTNGSAKAKTVVVAVTSETSGDRRAVVDELKAEEHKREEVELGGWPAGITTYRIGEMWFCKIDNVSPGATVARARGKTRDEAVDTATAAATRRLAATRVHR